VKVFRPSAPPTSYAITLELLDDGQWTTVPLWDNADDVDEPHEHGPLSRRSSPRSGTRNSLLAIPSAPTRSLTSTGHLPAVRSLPAVGER
jgi:hypothetical protein